MLTDRHIMHTRLKYIQLIIAISDENETNRRVMQSRHANRMPSPGCILTVIPSVSVYQNCNNITLLLLFVWSHNVSYFRDWHTIRRGLLLTYSQVSSPVCKIFGKKLP